MPHSPTSQGKATTSRRDRLFRASAPKPADFEFNDKVAEVFDDMLVRSIPMYLEQQEMIRELASKFWSPGTTIYDLGCSTATTLCNIGRVIEKPCRLMGFDNSNAMLDRAQLKIRKVGLEDSVSVRFADLNAGLEELKLENASVVTMCWTLQFVRPLNRERLVQSIYNSLVPGGALIVTEKTIANSPQMHRFFIDLYHDFKKRNKYSPAEIRRKREALENVLIPYRACENIELFQKNGFEMVETFFQWYNFAGYLCVKAGDQS
jgi:tRNA (cmo5U34)-methyltransferase